MQTSPPPDPTTALSTHLYYQVVYTLTDLLPPPLDGSPDALRTRNHAAIAKVAALLPVNANEIDLAAQCIAARAQAEDVLRLLRENADDIQLVMRLNAQYSSMVRTSLSVHGRLMRVQAVRQKREAIEGAANQDAWTLHVAERSMLKVADPDIERLKPAPRPAPVQNMVALGGTFKARESCDQTNTPALAASVDQSTEENALKIEQNLAARVLRQMRPDIGSSSVPAHC